MQHAARHRTHVSSAAGTPSCSGAAQPLARSRRPRTRQLKALCFHGNDGQHFAPNGGGEPRGNSINTHAPALRVAFRLPYRTSFGQALRLVGAGDERLGNWDVAKGVAMTWTDGDIWHVEMELAPPGPSCKPLALEYKYVVTGADGSVLAWKPGGNFELRIGGGGGDVGEGAGGGAAVAAVAADRWDGGVGDGGVSVSVRAGDVRVWDVWDGSVHDVHVEPPPEATAAATDSSSSAGAADADANAGAVDAARAARLVSEEEAEVAAVRAAVGRALDELSAALGSSVDLLSGAGADGGGADPASPEVLAADRVVAAATRKAVAMSRALRASQAAAAAALPAPGGGEGGGGGGTAA